MTSRREFLRLSAVAGGVLPFADPLFERLVPPAPAPLRILILGGTNFIGPYHVRYAVARGHHVTVFNRGRHQADLPASVEHLQGDRSLPDGLAALKGKTWDVVLDNPTSLPKWVRDAGEVLHNATQQYILTSTISVYPDQGTQPGADEDAPVTEYKGKDAFAEPRVTLELYGALKAVAEKEAYRQFPGSTTVVRPGLIVGPGDATDRFSYWPVRIDRGGEVLAPGDGLDPIQYVDVRDLTEWMIHLAENRVLGTYNATGPAAALHSAELLYGVRAACSGSNDVRFTWVPADFLEAQKVQPWSDMPVWIPRAMPDANVAMVSVRRAIAAGLTFRSLAVTSADTLAWFKTLPADRQAKLQAGLAADREAEVLKAWHAAGH